MKWFWITDTFENESEWMSHAIPEPLHTPILESLHGRGFLRYKDVEIKPGTVMTFDLPGMCVTTREYREVHLEGLTINIPCTDWEYMYEKLLDSKERTDASVPYYKLHCYLRCICFTPDQRKLVLEQMLSKMLEANAQREIENRLFNAAMDREGVVMEHGESAHEALRRATDAGKKPLVVVAKRPTKKDIGEA